MQTQILEEKKVKIFYQDYESEQEIKDELDKLDLLYKIWVEKTTPIEVAYLEWISKLSFKYEL